MLTREWWIIVMIVSTLTVLGGSGVAVYHGLNSRKTLNKRGQLFILVTVGLAASVATVCAIAVLVTA